MCSEDPRAVSETPERSPDFRGTLFVCATPIGNLDDLSPRALAVLRACDRIAAERPEHTRKLLARFGIPAGKLRPCAESTRERELGGLVEALRQGQCVALVSDAGTPGISDPGARLVALAVAAGCTVRPVPGPSSLTAALSISGFAFEQALFLGFPPRKPGERAHALERALAQEACVVLFESPERIRATLAAVGELAPRRPICLLREASKLHEEILRGTAAELLAALPESPIGEFTLVAAPPAPEERAGEPEQRDAWLVERITALREEQLSAREIVRALVLLAEIPRNHAQRLVRACIAREPGDDEEAPA